jgi:hypothetical protein
MSYFAPAFSGWIGKPIAYKWRQVNQTHLKCHAIALWQ